MRLARSLLFIALALFAARALAAPATRPVSELSRISEDAAKDAATSELHVQVVGEDGAALPVRVIVTAADGSHPDGSGRGVYRDGRFFAEGAFSVVAPAGATTVSLRCGPEYVPIDAKLELAAGRALRCKAVMRRWIDLAKLGWYAGDHHVHTQHDPKAVIRTDPGYTALQARANGLSLITEADPEFAADVVAKHATPAFLYRHAPEIRPGPFVGHLNTPGIAAPIVGERYDALVRRPLPAIAIGRAVRESGGVLIRTHTMTPPHLLHWMGAAEAWSDAALGECGDLMDIDGPASELLYFSALSLGNRVAASGYTDCALGRVSTPSPGDRRVYTHAERLDHAAIIAAMRQGRTFATNGGPVFAFLDVDGNEPGRRLSLRVGVQYRIRGVVHSLNPLLQVQAFGPEGLIKSFNVNDRSGEVTVELDRTVDHRTKWIVLRAQDKSGNWCITSPVYIDPFDPNAGAPAPTQASALLMEISNHTRFTLLRREFYAHLLVTVRPPEALTEVRLMRGAEVARAWKSDAGDQLHNKRIPVTDIFGEYGPGWMWHRERETACHFQADWPVTEEGWYTLEATTSTGRKLRGDAILYDPKHPNSRALSAARLEGWGLLLNLRGFGEEMPLADLKPELIADRWWYPGNTAYQMRAQFHGQLREATGGKSDLLTRNFRGEEAPRP